MEEYASMSPILSVYCLLPSHFQFNSLIGSLRATYIPEKVEWCADYPVVKYLVNEAHMASSPGQCV